ncbi:MAG: GTP 3',8-cyclase MoaA [Robiginitomaculum sp.]|nr:MAG: GTP 3',8-cyclase MoaA [Robiginitomaculum sp.]
MKQDLTDSYGRKITYLRLSLTDRCDLRCFYCMAEHMQFLPKKDLLSLEELARLTDAFIARGVRKIRLTGGEPLVRKGFMGLVHHLSAHLDAGRIDEIALTTNATQLSRYAHSLKAAGVERVNISLDSLNPYTFNTITRGGSLARVLEGVEAGLSAGLKLKINTVALKQHNVDEIPDLVMWAHGLGMDMTLIEVMPMGDTGEDRFDQYIPLTEIRARLDERWTLSDSPPTLNQAHSGPARYAHIAQTNGKLGFISPLSNNFCASCNRVRVTCTGKIYMCLGQGAYVDLKAAMRGVDSSDALNQALDVAIGRKPLGHDFEIAPTQPSTLSRFMSATGG